MPLGLTKLFSIIHTLDCAGPGKVVKREKLVSVKRDAERRKIHIFVQITKIV